MTACKIVVRYFRREDRLQVENEKKERRTEK
jgi:hypothetical protein